MRVKISRDIFRSDFSSTPSAFRNAGRSILNSDTQLSYLIRAMSRDIDALHLLHFHLH